jgi:drug/metabolite transporter (DMT)-like permease
MTQNTHPNTLGLAAMLTAMVLLPVGDALSKLVVATYPAEQITWVRNVVHVALVLPLALRGGGRLPLGRLHLLRGLMFLAMTVFYIAALFWMPLADAQSVIFTFPLMVMAGSALFLGHPVGHVRWGMAAVGMLGVLLVVQPGFQEISIGVPLALLAAVAAATYILLTRHLTGSAPQLMLLVMPAVVSVVLLLPVIPWRWVTPDLEGLGIMILIGVLSALIHLLLIIAYSRAEPSAMAPLAYLQLVFGVLLGWWMFGDLPNAVGAAGIGLIVLSGVVISLREKRRAKTGS